MYILLFNVVQYNHPVHYYTFFYGYSLKDITSYNKEISVEWCLSYIHDHQTTITTENIGVTKF